MQRSAREVIRELHRLGFEDSGYTGRGHLKLAHPLLVEHHLVVGHVAPGRPQDNLLAEGRREVRQANERWQKLHQRIEAGEDQAQVLDEIAKAEGITFEGLRTGYRRWKVAQGLETKGPLADESRQQYERVAKYVNGGVSVVEAAEQVARETSRKPKGVEVGFYNWLKLERNEGRDHAPSVGQRSPAPLQVLPPLPPAPEAELRPVAKSGDNGAVLLTEHEQRDIVQTMRNLLLPDLNAERELAVDALRSARHALEQSQQALEEITAALEQLTGQGVEPVA